MTGPEELERRRVPRDAELPSSSARAAQEYLERLDLADWRRRRRLELLAELAILAAIVVAVVGVLLAELRLAEAANAEPGGPWDWARFGLGLLVVAGALATRPWRRHLP